ncbi:transposase [Paraburkholderia adhaesiva]|uniref:transposase n=1 Tax=Paraburkholderia adhaesiva TaxID=2883244 RepID=UPI001F28EAF2|nr:transposase [Paraburkholderia adhaesiva]
MEIQTSSRTCPELTETQWQSIGPLFHGDHPDATRRGRGRPAHSARAVFEAIHWVLWTASVWAALPERYPDFRTCHRRFKVWFEAGLVQQAMKSLYGDEGLDLCAAMGERMQACRRSPGFKPRFRTSPGLGWSVAQHKADN